MRDLQNILIESLLDDEDTLTKPIEDFFLKPFQSIFNCGPKIKSQGDWEHYVKLLRARSMLNANLHLNTEEIMYILQKDIKNNGYYRLKMRGQITVK